MSMLPRPMAPVLAEMELFEGLSPAALSEVAASAVLRPLAEDTVIFLQGDVALACHALLEGRVRITQSDDDGAELLVRFIGPGEMFGTVALFTDRRYPAEALAVLDSTEIRWPEAALLDLIERHPRIALNIVGIMGKRLQEVQERLREVASQRVERRMAHALLRLEAHEIGSGKPGSRTALPLTRKDMADMCGATLYTASRILTAWEKSGLIVSRRKRVRICNRDGLQRIADNY